MAIRHINQKAKEESGVVVSREDAKKVVSFLTDRNKTKKQFIKSTKSFEESINTIKKLRI